MKTSTSEVRCDGCGGAIPVAYLWAIFATLRGPKVGHRKFDFCGAACLRRFFATVDFPEEFRDDSTHRAHIAAAVISEVGGETARLRARLAEIAKCATVATEAICHGYATVTGRQAAAKEALAEINELARGVLASGEEPQ